jgi:predicted nucleotidyltransferase
MEHASDAAMRLARRLKSERHVVSACLLGSFARGQDDPFSDLDILAVVEDRSETTLLHRQAALMPAALMGHPIQVRTLRRSHLAELVKKRTLFAAHLAQEAQIAFDRRRDLRRAKREFDRNPGVDESPAELKGKFGPYEQLAWCRGHYLICLADLYMLGRSGAMLALAKHGTYEFGRRDVFVRHSDVFPELSAAATSLGELEPYYMRVRRGVLAPLPFVPRDCDLEAERARDACRALLDAIP